MQMGEEETTVMMGMLSLEVSGSGVTLWWRRFTGLVRTMSGEVVDRGQ